jgi:hypothetical protein
VSPAAGFGVSRKIRLDPRTYLKTKKERASTARKSYQKGTPKHRPSRLNRLQLLSNESKRRKMAASYQTLSARH